MDFKFSAELDEVRRRTRQFLDANWPKDRRAYAMNDMIARDLPGLERNSANVTPEEVREFYRKLGDAGILGIGFPEAYGGSGGGHLARYVVQSELCAAGAPYPNVGLTMVAPIFMTVGSPDFLAKNLPPLMAGEVEYCVGYTEPSAGTDLASLVTRAERDGNHFLINGQKIFSSTAHYADYYFLAARTDPSAPKHKGISLFLLDMKHPGIMVMPLVANSGVRTNIVFLDNVRVPASCLLGNENEGWKYLTEALAFERYASMASTPLVVGYNALALDPGLAEMPENSAALARLRAEVRASDLLSLNAAWTAEDGRPPIVEAAAAKVAVSETRLALGRAALEMLGPNSLLTEFNEQAPAGGQFDLMYRHSVINLFTAGANDVQRDTIATAGQHLPRSRKSSAKPTDQGQR
ncbi:MAG TPA: acyl-CoA dehydrogenase family protein [Sphingobium sp.]|uniref:acyl-CoA dehydrogenase family protein n=1 Tax=Sphingobium sp. TaxID=1912891 RepID=UPI002ED08368